MLCGSPETLPVLKLRCGWLGFGERRSRRRNSINFCLIKRPLSRRRRSELLTSGPMRFKSPRDERPELIAIAGPVGQTRPAHTRPLVSVLAITAHPTSARLKSAPVAAAAAAAAALSSLHHQPATRHCL